MPTPTLRVWWKEWRLHPPPPSLSDSLEGTTRETSFLGFPQQPESKSASPSDVGPAPLALEPSESKRAARRKRLEKDLGALTVNATPDLGKGPEVPSPSTKRLTSPGCTSYSQARNQGKKPRVGPWKGTCRCTWPHSLVNSHYKRVTSTVYATPFKSACAPTSPHRKDHSLCAHVA